MDREPLVAASLESMVRELGAGTVFVARGPVGALAYLKADKPALSVIDLALADPDFARLVRRLDELGAAALLVSVYSKQSLEGGEWASRHILDKPFADADFAAAAASARHAGTEN